MNSAKQRKLQHILITQLLEEGRVELILPDGIILEIGITQEDKNGDQVKVDDYCYVVSTRLDRSTMMDRYNLGLQFEKTDDTIVYDGETSDVLGRTVQVLDIV